VPAQIIGQVGALGSKLQITTSSGTLDATLDRLDEAYHEAIPNIMSRPSAQ
jgi:hypothetical protein